MMTLDKASAPMIPIAEEHRFLANAHLVYKRIQALAAQHLPSKLGIPFHMKLFFKVVTRIVNIAIL